MVPKVSVVVPVYNVQEYLSQCLDSLYSQSYVDLEVILVNDGSTDNSLKICQEYAKLYTNTNLIIKENSGLSDTRNVGTIAAKGNYIYYLDSDDWLAPNAIKSLCDFAIENESCIDSTLGSLEATIQHNGHILDVSPYMKRYLVDTIEEWRNDQRNGHFHKHNLCSTVDSSGRRSRICIGRNYNLIPFSDSAYSQIQLF